MADAVVVPLVACSPEWSLPISDVQNDEHSDSVEVQSTVDALCGPVKFGCVLETQRGQLGYRAVLELCALNKAGSTHEREMFARICY